MIDSAKFRGFICYAHMNSKAHSTFKDRLQVKINSEDSQIHLFSDVDIQASQKWDNRIKDNLANSDFFIILASNDLFASDYVKNEEFPRILKANQDGKIILPVKVSPTGYGPNIFKELKKIQYFRPSFFKENDTFGDWLEKPLDSTAWQDKYINEFYDQLMRSLNEYKKSKKALPDNSDGLIQTVSGLPHIIEARSNSDLKRELRLCTPDEKMINASNRMRKRPMIRHLVVVQNEEMTALRGIISRRDIAGQEISGRFISKENTSQLPHSIKNKTVSEVMTHHNPPNKIVYSLDVDAPIIEAFKLFSEKQNGHAIGALPILYNDEVLEIISYSDLLGHWKLIFSDDKIEDLNKLKANDLGTKGRIASLNADDTLGLAYFNVSNPPYRRSIPIVDDDEHLLGMISDISVYENTSDDNEERKITEFMRIKDFGLTNYLNLDSSFEHIISVMTEERDLTSLPIVDDQGRLEGIVSYTDVLKEMIKVYE